MVSGDAMEALFFERTEKKMVECRLCRHRCRIAPGRRGLCGVRENRDGTLYALTYGRLIAEHVDHIEKKPLFHVLPGSKSYSIATVGCNFTCLNCQNSEISQAARVDPTVVEAPERVTAPVEVVAAAQRTGCASIAFTYTEPTVFYEYALAVAEAAAPVGLKNLFVTNGYIEETPLARLAPVLHAANVDLKGFSERMYREVCGARLDRMLEAIRAYHRLGIWMEVTTLVIPGVNDSEAELQGIAEFLVGLSPEIPWHVTRFHPDYRMLDREATPVSTLRRGVELGRAAGLKFVYMGNVPGEGEETRCPQCGRVLIRRLGFVVEENKLKAGRCPHCQATVAGVWA